MDNGKFTINPAHHSGEGIYFAAKVLSRWQAERLTLRFERFQTAVLDFAGVAEIGRAFADEVFRVIQNAHPKTALQPANRVPAVTAMVSRAKAAGRS